MLRRAATLTAWIKKNVADKRDQQLLIGAIAVALVATSVSLISRGLYGAISSVAVLALLVLFLVFFRSLFVAMDTIPAAATDTEAKRIRTAKGDARRNLLWLSTLLLLLGSAVAVWFFAWSEASFRVHYALWRLRAIDLRELVNAVEAGDHEGDRVLASTQVSLVPISDLRWLRMEGNVIDEASIPEALRLLTRRDVADISVPLNVVGDDGRIAVIAAKQIVFGSNGRLVHGSRAVLLLAHDFRFEPGSRIEAWGSVAAQAALPSERGDGAAAGDVRIIALGKVSGTVLVDSYGQVGRSGAQGPDTPAWTDADRPPRTTTYGPHWSLREYRTHELERARKAIETELSVSQGQARADQLRRAIGQIDACIRNVALKKDMCLAVLCDESNAEADPKDRWENRREGARGKPGQDGLQGGVGGASGAPGKVFVTLSSDKYVASFHWPNGSRVDQRAPALDGAPGGPGGKPGVGGRGGEGAKSDPFGACQPGNEGPLGEASKKHGAQGEPGSKRLAPEPVTVQKQTLGPR
ncbi:MAG: hypothetical protein U1F54_11310 [Burkholderiales bacterium]